MSHPTKGSKNVVKIVVEYIARNLYYYRAYDKHDDIIDLWETHLDPVQTRKQLEKLYPNCDLIDFNP